MVYEVLVYCREDEVVYEVLVCCREDEVVYEVLVYYREDEVVYALMVEKLSAKPSLLSQGKLGKHKKTFFFNGRTTKVRVPSPQTTSVHTFFVNFFPLMKKGNFFLSGLGVL